MAYVSVLWGGTVSLEFRCGISSGDCVNGEGCNPRSATQRLPKSTNTNGEEVLTSGTVVQHHVRIAYM